MKTDQIENLRRRMGECAALPADDPQRVALVHEIAAAGDWAEAEWVDLLNTDEHLRIELQRVEVPVDLSERLVAIPDQSAIIERADRQWWRQPMVRLGALAAAAAITIVVGLQLLTPAVTDGDHYQSVASHAVINYAHEIDNKYVTADPAELKISLAADVPQLDVAVPQTLPQVDVDARLAGGRMCHLGEATVVCTEWIADGQRYALYQFDQTDFDLPRTFDSRTIRISRADGVHGLATLWAGADGRAYVLVRQRDDRSDSDPPL